MSLRISWNNRPALNARMAVERYGQMYGLRERAVRSAVARSGVPPIEPPPLSAKIPLYDLAALDKAMAEKYAP
jgi:hypothetical protein